MTRFVLIGVAVLLVLAFAGWRVRTQAPNEYEFPNRALVRTSNMRRLGAKTLPPVVVQHHDAVSNQLLIVRDRRVFTHPYFASPSSGPWSFAGVIRHAFQVGQVPSGTAEPGLVTGMRSVLTDALYPAGGTFNSNWNGNALESAPVHLLAIVNRLDLAKVDKTGCLRGAEVRFVYEALPDPIMGDYLKLIVEFVLPCMTPGDFQKLAQSWSSLETLSMDPDGSGNYPHQVKLKALLDGLTFLSARLRANGNSSAGSWYPSEFLFQSSGVVLNRLEREPNIITGFCQDSKSNLGQFAAAETQPILDSDYQYDNWPTAGNQPLVCTPGVGHCQPSIVGPDSHVLVLGADVLSDNQRDEVRFSLSVNTCTACHGAETKTGILQIGTRDPGNTTESQLSGFLTGEPNCQPSDSPSGKTKPTDPDVQYCTAKISGYSNPSPPGKCADVTKQDRSFNDLLRRHLFIYTVLQLDPAAPWQTWKTALDPFTAYQVD